MARVCMRPGCDRPAEVRLSYDTVSCQVWLDPVPELQGPVQEICEFHALRLTVPRGWILCDRRVASPALFVTSAVPTAVPTVVPAGAPTGPSSGSVTAPTSVPPAPIAGPSASPEVIPEIAPAAAATKADSPAVPLTVGAPTPKVGSSQSSAAINQVKRRHPNATASELFADALKTDAAPEVDALVADRPVTEATVSEVPDAEESVAAGVEAELAADEAKPAEPEVAPEKSESAEQEPESQAPDELESGAQESGESDADAGADTDPDEPAKMDRAAPTSPLLARAFAQTGPQRSVLSDDLRVPDQKRPNRHGR